jgi:hypothetical protein
MPLKIPAKAEKRSKSTSNQKIVWGGAYKLQQYG